MKWICRFCGRKFSYGKLFIEHLNSHQKTLHGKHCWNNGVLVCGWPEEHKA